MSEFTVGFYSMFNRGEWEIERSILEPAGAKAIIANTQEEFEAILDRFEVLIVANYNISGENIRKMKKCKALCRQGVGMDNIDIEAAKEMGIVVCNVPDCSQQEVGDHTAAMMLSAVRCVPFYNQKIKTDRIWDHQSYPPMKSFRDVTVFLIGFGKIGQLVVDRVGNLFGKILAYDPYMNREIAAQKGVIPVDSIDEGIPQADIVSLHLPLIPGSEHFGNGVARNDETALFHLRRASELGDMTALDRALNEGKLAGAALDVVENEHLPELGVFDHPIFSNPKVFFTPHTGWYGEGSRKKARVDAAMDARAIMEGREPKNRYA